MNSKVKLPAIFVRELVIFPGMSITVTVGREATRRAVSIAQERFQDTIVSLTQLRAEDTEIRDLAGLYKLGTICRIEKVVTLTDGTMQVHVEGLSRYACQTIEWQDGLPMAEGESIPETTPPDPTEWRQTLESLSSYQPLHRDKIAWLERDDPEELKRLNAQIAKRQAILEEPSTKERLKRLKELM